jgi:osmoprotectant transport system permease protein
VSYLTQNPDIVLALFVEHVQMTGVALLVALAIALPVGTLIANRPHLAAPVLTTFGILYTVPSLALMILLVPLFGLNATSVVVALILYAQVVLLRNVLAGLQSVDPAVNEAARGVGMSDGRRWWAVQLPLALPIILAGVRVAAVTVIGIAAIGAKFGAGGLGRLLFDGIAQNRMDKIWAGAIALGVLAFAVSGLVGVFERVARRGTHVAERPQRVMHTSDQRGSV